MCICLFYIFLFEFCKLLRVGYTGKNGKRIFQGLADSTLDVVIGGVNVAVTVQYIAETGNDAARGIGKRIIEVKEVGCIIYMPFCGKVMNKLAFYICLLLFFILLFRRKASVACNISP